MIHFPQGHQFYSAVIWKEVKGRVLTESDINKKVLRTAAFMTQSVVFGFDNSYIPSSIKEMDEDSVLFGGFKRDKEGIKLVFKTRFPPIFRENEEYHVFESSYLYYNDGNWITVEEAKRQLGL